MDKKLVRFDKRGVSTLQRARGIASTLGVRRAAGYMRNCGGSVEVAVEWLVYGPHRLATRS